MPISLTVLPPGAPTSAVALRDLTTQIETYVNEQTVAADRTTAWLESVHLFRPDFQYALASKESPMPGGHIFWNTRTPGRSQAQIFSYYQGNGPIVVPGLSRTIQLPEDPGLDYAVLVRAWFVAYEYGGEDDLLLTQPLDSDYGGVARCAEFRLQFNDGTPVASSRRACFAASDGIAPTDYMSRFYARKQHTMLHAVNGATLGGAGTHDIKVVCLPETPPGGIQRWKHILVTQGTMIARCRLR